MFGLVLKISMDTPYTNDLYLLNFLLSLGTSVIYVICHIYKKSMIILSVTVTVTVTVRVLISATGCEEAAPAETEESGGPVGVQEDRRRHQLESGCNRSSTCYRAWNKSLRRNQGRRKLHKVCALFYYYY